jgi:uncharacterized protein YndB with AHSA1/START domain
MTNPITITNTVLAPITNVWVCYTRPAHITKWNFASLDWCCPRASGDLKAGGRFSSRMEAKDGSMGFNFGGIYTAVAINKLIGYTMVDADKEPDVNSRKATIEFESISSTETKITVNFEPENENPVEMQKGGWQSILDNFKKHTEEEYQAEITTIATSATISITLI